jgi:hypothetical protein
MMLVIAVAFGCNGRNSNAALGSKRNIQREVSEIRLMQEPHEVARAYEALFKDSDEDLIRALKLSPHVDVALRAAWEEVRVTLPAADKKPPIRPNVGLLHGFAGFMEGTLSISPPKWWRKTLVNSMAYRRSNVFFAPSDNVTYHQTDVGLRSFKDVVAVRNGDDVYIARGDKSIHIRNSDFEEMLKDLRPRPKFLSVELDDRFCFLAFYDDVCVPYPLVCIDRKSNKPIWSAKAWASAVTAYSGFGAHSVEILSSADGVFVFGAGVDCLYVEGFNRDDGTSLFRFSTSR